MDEFEEFEKSAAWKESCALAVLIYEHTERGGWTLDFILRDETRKSVLAISTEIARAYGFGADMDFRRQMRKARSTCFALITLLHIGSDLGYVPGEEIERPLQAIKTVVRMIDDTLFEVARRRNR